LVSYPNPVDFIAYKKIDSPNQVIITFIIQQQIGFAMSQIKFCIWLLPQTQVDAIVDNLDNEPTELSVLQLYKNEGDYQVSLNWAICDDDKKVGDANELEAGERRFQQGQDECLLRILN
ncbi:MAG: hypothetical protein EZS28_026915, partial [Streblomastix strix]